LHIDFWWIDLILCNRLEENILIQLQLQACSLKVLDSNFRVLKQLFVRSRMEAQKVPIKVEAKLLLPREEYTLMARKHFEKKGYRVHSGLQFGSDLVLYADSPDRVHSDFCVHVIPEGEILHE